MEFLAYIVVICLIIFGTYSMFKDAREKGIWFVIIEVVAIIVLAAMGL